MGWSIHFRYTRNTLGTFRTRVGLGGEFSFLLDHPPFLNRQRKAGRSFPAFVEPVLQKPGNFTRLSSVGLKMADGQGEKKLFPPRERLVSDIPAGDRNVANLFYGVGFNTR